MFKYNSSYTIHNYDRNVSNLDCIERYNENIIVYSCDIVVATLFGCDVVQDNVFGIYKI